MIEVVDPVEQKWHKKMREHPKVQYRLIADSITYSRSAAYTERKKWYRLLLDYGYEMHQNVMIYVTQQHGVYTTDVYLTDLDGIIMMRMVPEANEFLKRNIFKLEERA
jgi:hypothetical protein